MPASIEKLFCKLQSKCFGNLENIVRNTQGALCTLFHSIYLRLSVPTFSCLIPSPMSHRVLKIWRHSDSASRIIFRFQLIYQRRFKTERKSDFFWIGNSFSSPWKWRQQKGEKKRLQESWQILRNLKRPQKRQLTLRTFSRFFEVS